MHRAAPRISRKLEALLDERDDLQIRINLEADRPDADSAKLMAMSRRLAQVEDEIVTERRSQLEPVTSEELNAIRSARGKWPDTEAEPEDDSLHFYVCKACGQAVDKRRLGDVFHHEEAGHSPIPSDS